MLFIYFQDGCPASQGSASTESYCDISDSPSSLGELSVSLKKRVAKRPVLPVWQQECLKSYGDSPASKEKFKEYTNSYGDSPASKEKFKEYTNSYGDSPASKEKFKEYTNSENVATLDHIPIGTSRIDRLCESNAHLQSSLRSIDNEEDSYRWRQASASNLRERGRYDEQCDFDYESRKAKYEIGESDYIFDEEVRNPVFSTSEYRLVSTLSTLPAGRRPAEDGSNKDTRFYLEKQAVKDVDTLETVSTRNSRKELWSSETYRKKNRSFDFPKSKPRSQGAGGGLLNAVAYFENLEKAAQPGRKRFGQSSLKSFKTQDASTQDFEAKPSLSFSPFQLDISSKSDKYLLELERKTEAQYNDIKEKLGESSLCSLDQTTLDLPDEVMRIPSPTKLEKLSNTDSRHSTMGVHGRNVREGELQRDSTLVANRVTNIGKSGGSDGLNFGENTKRTTHRIVVTKKEFDKDFGFSISERVEGQGIYIKSIQASTGGSGKLKKYDRLLQVRYICMSIINRSST